MKHNLAVLAFVSALAACHSEAPQQAGAANEGAAADPGMDVPALNVAATSVHPEDVTVLAQANWTGKACALNLEGVDEKQVDVPANDAGATHLAGYFIDPDDKPAGDFSVALMGPEKNYLFPAKTGWDRTDVADYFRKPELATSGFQVNVDLSGVPAGTYKLNYVVDRGAKGKFFCESGKAIVVGGAPAAASAPVAAADATTTNGEPVAASTPAGSEGATAPAK